MTAVLDLDHLELRSLISDPHQYSRGVKHLLIDGEPVIDKEQYTGKLPGQVLKLKREPRAM